MQQKEYLKIALLAVIGMIIFVSLFSSVVVPLSALELELNLGISHRGVTSLTVPPFGMVMAQTHLPPLNLQVTLNNINLEMLQEAIPRFAQEEYIDQLQHQIRQFLYYFVLRVLALGFLGGAAGVYLSGMRQIKPVLMGGSIGLVLIGIFILAAIFSYNTMAFSNPEFEGVLSAAPWMVGLVEESIIKVNTLGEQMEVMATSIYNVFEKIDRIEPLGVIDGELKVLHVSDIHNNPVGMKFTSQVINTFDVDLVIDTGDVTDFGTPLEADLIADLVDFDVPYVFVPGNHDSPEVISRMKEIDNVIVLEEGKINMLGLVIAGIKDPSSRSVEMVVREKEVLQDYAQRLEVVVEEGEPTDIVAVHHPAISDGLIGSVPVILNGHTHSLDVQDEQGTMLFNAGTTGAAGIRGFQTRKEVPYSVVLLHFAEEEEAHRLIAYDIIKVFQLHSGFSLERVLLPQDVTEEES